MPPLSATHAWTCGPHIACVHWFSKQRFTAAHWISAACSCAPSGLPWFVHALRQMPVAHWLSHDSTICLHVHVPGGPGGWLCGGGFATHAATSARSPDRTIPRPYAVSGAAPGGNLSVFYHPLKLTCRHAPRASA